MKYLKWLFTGRGHCRHPHTNLVLKEMETNLMSKLDDLKVLVDAVAAEAKADVDRAVAAMNAAVDALNVHAADPAVIDAISGTVSAARDELSGALTDATAKLEAAVSPPAPTA